MIIAVFRSRTNPKTQEEFDDLYSQMTEHIGKIKGYVNHKMFAAKDGENCVIAEFADEKAFLEWDVHPEHKKAKERGKAEVFLEYDVAVATIFERHSKP